MIITIVILHVCAVINTTSSFFRWQGSASVAAGAPGASGHGGSGLTGAKDCTPEVDTSEIVVDFRWYFPTDLLVAFSDRISLSLWHVPKFKGLVAFPVDFYWKCPMDIHWDFPTEFHSCVISGV